MASSVRALVPAFALLTLSSIATSACVARTPLTLAVEEGAPTTWGDFAATLDVPDCPSSNPVLMVNTTADELDGEFIGYSSTLARVEDAGPTLSLREALWIVANNADTPHSIFFAAAVFPAAQPATIVLDGAFRFPSVSGACIDARHRGVVVAWPPPETLACCDYGGSCSPGCTWGLRGSRQVGLTLLGAPMRHIVGSGAQVAGCRFNTDGRVSVRGNNIATIEIDTATDFGPGNVIGALAGVSYGVFVGNTLGPVVTVRDNYFGYDPMTREHFAAGERAIGVNNGGPVSITDNVFVLGTVAIGNGGMVGGDTTPILVTGNWLGYLGADGDTEALSEVVSTATFVSAIGGRFTVGPDNVVTGIAAVAEMGTSGVLLTRNRLFGNTAVLVGGTQPAAPTVNTATSLGASGTCSAAGLVEIFSDASDQGEQFLGDARCDPPGLAWQLTGVDVPRRRNVTATLTDAQAHTSVFSAPVYVP